MTVHQLIYHSKAAPSAESRLASLRDILAASRRNNARDGITGFLIYDASSFVQILEGERSAVSAAFSRIERDPRHSNAAIVQTRNAPQRSFPVWSMGGGWRSPEHQAVYLRHGISDALDSNRMSAASILALAMDLQDYERAKRPSAA